MTRDIRMLASVFLNMAKRVVGEKGGRSDK